jgi:uncharacterized protein YqgC (DUF456 family)
MPTAVAEILTKSGLVLLYIVLFATLALTLFGLGGNWVLVGVALVIKLTGLSSMTWTWLVVIVAIAAVGEIIEALLGLVVVAKKGGTRWGVIGAFVGGIAGVVLGAPVVPPIGSLVFGFVGAFAGAAGGEYLRNQRVEEALRVGFWSFVGRSLAAMGKVAAGFCIVWIIIVTTW